MFGVSLIKFTKKTAEKSDNEERLRHSQNKKKIKHLMVRRFLTELEKICVSRSHIVPLFYDSKKKLTNVAQEKKGEKSNAQRELLSTKKKKNTTCVWPARNDQPERNV